VEPLEVRRPSGDLHFSESVVVTQLESAADRRTQNYGSRNESPPARKPPSCRECSVCEPQRRQNRSVEGQTLRVGVAPVVVQVADAKSTPIPGTSCFGRDEAERPFRRSGSQPQFLRRPGTLSAVTDADRAGNFSRICPSIRGRFSIHAINGKHGSASSPLQGPFSVQGFAPRGKPLHTAANNLHNPRPLG